MSFFSGGVPSGAFSIFPLIFRITLSVFAFDNTVMLLLIIPRRLVSYDTLIISLLPGRIGCRGQLGTVHPQEDITLERIKGSFPVFVNLNSHWPLSP